jgi:predicted AlkP superfamily phosphohydrolase/phosphomutase
MPRRVISIAMDACDAGVARAFTTRGVMPNLARLLDQSSRCRIDNPFGLFVSAVWVSYATCLRAGKHGFHCWEQIDPSTYEHQLNSPRVTHLPSFWRQLSDAGRSVAVIDVPHHRADGPLDGLEVSEWGCHDRHFGFRSEPPELADEIERSYGLHPVLGIDARRVHDFAPDDGFKREGLFRKPQEEKALLDGCLDGIATKRRMMMDLLRRRDWDFFACVFGEGHAIGHQQWHLHDSDHPRFDAQLAADLGGDPVAQVYRAMDAALGEVMDEAGEDCLLLLQLSHGMGPHNDCCHMLEEVLARLDAHDRAKPAAASLRRLASPVVPPLRRLAHALRVPAALRGRIGEWVQPRYWTAEARARQRYFAEPNNTVFGGIRLNLAGREPRGVVHPEEVDALCARIAADLLDLADAETGKRVVRAVYRCDDYHERHPGDTMPDLLVDWMRGRQPHTLISPKFGRLHSSYVSWRSGDHRPNGLLVARGPGLPAGEEMPSIAVEDIGATIARYLGVTLEAVDGSPAAWLAEGRATPATGA